MKNGENLGMFGKETASQQQKFDLEETTIIHFPAPP